MRVLICGEGPHEIGQPRFWCSRTKDYISLEGWMHIICGRMLPDSQFEVRRRSAITLLDRERRRFMPLPDGHGAKSLAARLIAQREGFHVVIYMVDGDTNQLAEWRRKRDEVLDGFRRAENGVLAIACIPMAASESWMLSDQEAWMAKGLTEPHILPKRPEEIWGLRDDPEGDHPHRYFYRVCVASDLPDSRETRCELAELTDLNTLKKQCPNSFGAFVSDMSAISII